MWWLRMFFSRSPIWAEGKLVDEVVETLLTASDTAGLLQLRDSAYAFIDKINTELVREGRRF